MSEPITQGATGEYEFSESENTVFRGLATAMKVGGLVSLSLGALLGIGFGVLVVTHRIGQGALSIVLGMIMIAIGIWNRDLAGPIERIVTSQGNDITHLMQAMTKLKKIYSLQQTLLLAGILLVGFSFFIGLNSR